MFNPDVKSGPRPYWASGLSKYKEQRDNGQEEPPEKGVRRREEIRNQRRKGIHFKRRQNAKNNARGKTDFQKRQKKNFDPPIPHEHPPGKTFCKNQRQYHDQHRENPDIREKSLCYGKPAQKPIQKPRVIK